MNNNVISYLKTRLENIRKEEKEILQILEDLESGSEIVTEESEKEIITETKLVIYTDGNCSGVGTPSASSGSGVYVAENHPYNGSYKIAGEQTNNRAECWAVIKALDREFPPGIEIEIRSDSTYAVNMANRSWKAKENLDLVKKMRELVKKHNVTMTHIRRDSEPGNTKADLLARRAM